MADVELVKKMLRAVLQANKGGISLPRLQSEYKELTGEQIPHKQMGYNHLDALLASMPSFVHLERNRSGEVCDLFFWVAILSELRKRNSGVILYPTGFPAVCVAVIFRVVKQGSGAG